MTAKAQLQVSRSKISILTKKLRVFPMAECYTEMSEESDIEASDLKEIELCNRINLKPYDMEPRLKCEHGEVEFMASCLFSITSF